jgi:hypothetical protein
MKRWKGSNILLGTDVVQARRPGDAGCECVIQELDAAWIQGWNILYIYIYMNVRIELSIDLGKYF